jgi:amidase
MIIERLLWEEDATGLAGKIHAGDVAPIELVDAAIARAERVNPEINAIIEKQYEDARERAKNADRQAPLAGVPYLIKDLTISQKGVPTHSGSRAPAFTPDFDSVLIERCRAAGLIPIATTSTPEHGLRLMTETAAFGITRNPWNTAHTSGGSSGGAAALVAAGVSPMAHASDGGGSIRVPSACTGLVGLKPSRGRIPLSPAISEGWHGLTGEHAVTRTVRDTALLLDLTHGPDVLAPYAARPPRGTFAAAAARAPGRLRLAFYQGSPLGLPVSAETLQAMNAAVGLAREGGHSVEEIILPMIGEQYWADFAFTIAASIAGTMQLESQRIGRSIMGDLERGTRVIARFGGIISAGEAHAALLRLHAVSRQIVRETERYDAVLMPLIAHPPLPCGAMNPKGADELLENTADKLRLTRLLRLKPFRDKLITSSLWFTHWPAIQNISGQPAIALPVHVTKEGLPLGIQAVGRPGEEETLLSLAGQLEKISNWPARRAPFHVPKG